MLVQCVINFHSFCFSCGCRQHNYVTTRHCVSHCWKSLKVNLKSISRFSSVLLYDRDFVLDFDDRNITSLISWLKLQLCKYICDLWSSIAAFRPALSAYMCFCCRTQDVCDEKLKQYRGTGLRYFPKLIMQWLRVVLASLGLPGVYIGYRWRFGAVGSDVGQINEVTLRQAWLVLGWVTVSGFNSWCGKFISV